MSDIDLLIPEGYSCGPEMDVPQMDRTETFSSANSTKGELTQKIRKTIDEKEGAEKLSKNERPKNDRKKMGKKASRKKEQ